MVTTWNTLFGALLWVGAFIVVLFYYYPKFFESTLPNTYIYSPLYKILAVYILIWLVLLLIRYIYDVKTHAENAGLWKLNPEHAQSAELYDPLSHQMIHSEGMVDLLSESDANRFLSETFTFGFFVSVDHSSIESVNGSMLKNQYKPYQLIITLPGVYDIYIDPFHEMLMIEFHSYKTSSYKVLLPTLKIQRWHQILLTVEGRTVDIYQNGVLIKSIMLQNVVQSHPGKPKINMNPDMYANVAFVQSWPKRLKEPEIITNYKWHSGTQGVPVLPKVRTDIMSALNLNGFCIGTYCWDSDTPETDALSYVDYTCA